ncbi:MAG TPA: ATP-dependent DNA ligase [Terriglobales bacterium]|nr:ATP-dependent DNA ligase [Terriglobales bacterium]
MRKFAEACERIAGTTKKLEKTAIVADYLKSNSPEEASVAVFLSGRPFPVWEETTLQVGGRLLWQVVGELSGKSQQELTAAYRKHGDLGAVAAEVLPQGRVGTGALARPSRAKLGSAGESDAANIADGSSPSTLEVQAAFRRIAAARGPAAKASLVRELLSQVTALEAKYIVKIVTGDLRIGLKESLVEEAIAKAYGSKLSEVQRANMLLGDIGETLQLAAKGNMGEAGLSDVKMRLFHPLGFMLASPAQSAEEGLSYFKNALVEDKYDGIRAQAHCSGGEVRIFSRTRDEITESFPELPDALAGLPQDAILDGEIVAWNYLAAESGEAGRALPFSALQQRLGRKKVSDQMMRRMPVAYLVFDVLYARGELLIDRPLRERAEMLDELMAAPRIPTQARSGGAQGQLMLEPTEPTITAQVFRASVFRASSPQELDQLFKAAQARGNEGLMIKNPESAYTPGRRGKSWLKLKRELATLDVVVTAVEYGHGKRISVLSDYTFAVRDGERLVNIGKAYSGLTDAEIAEMTKWFLEHTVEDEGSRLIVEPKIVLEVAFNNMMRSDRHESGYALRFPRVVRLRPDKLPEEADAIERAQEIYEKQKREPSN